MKSFQKAIGLLALFDEKVATLSVEEIADRSAIPLPTLYRYIQNLRAAGLLIQIRTGTLALGPRIAELDRLMRIGDPLLLASDAIFPKVLQNIKPSALILSRYAGNDTVLTIRADATRTDGIEQRFLRERGIPYGLLKGASSLVILAYSSRGTIRRAYANDPDYVQRFGMGETLGDFSAYLANIRRRGYARTTNTFHTDRTSVAVPIADLDGNIAASLARTLEMGLFDRVGELAVLDDLHFIQREFTRQVNLMSPAPITPRKG